MKIREYKYNLDLGKIGNCFCEYDRGYIRNIMFEIANNHTDLYNQLLLKWLSDNLANAHYIEEAVNEYGIDSENFNFYKLIAQGQFMQNYKDLQKHLNDSLLNYAFNYIEHYLDNIDVTEEQFDQLTLKDYEKFNKLEEIDDFIKEVLGVE